MTTLYIAAYYPCGGLGAIRTSAYETRDAAAQALFRLCRKARSCQTARACLVDGEIVDTGIDIWFHDRGDCVGFG